MSGKAALESVVRCEVVARVHAVLRSMPGRLLTREQLRWQVHGQSTRVAERNIDLLVARLRHKLGRVPQGAHAIRTVRGKG